MCVDSVTEIKFNNEGKSGFPCNICSKILTRKFDLYSHLITHAKKQYPCRNKVLSGARSAFVTDVKSNLSDEVHLLSSEGKKILHLVCVQSKGLHAMYVLNLIQGDLI